jgi:hypothetical protein
MTDPTAAGEAPTQSAPDKIRVGAILDTSNLNIGIEDVLAARVLKKTLLAQVALLGTVATLVLYVGWDVKNTRSELRKAQEALDTAIVNAQARITLREAEVQQHVEASKGLIGSANGMVSSARELVKSTGDYQNELARNLTAIGENQATTRNMQGDVQRTRGEIETLATALTREIGQSQAAREQAERQRRSDSVHIVELEGDVTNAVLAYRNTFTQLVEEDTPTPVAGSGFTFEFDDLEEGNRTATVATLTYNDQAVENWHRRKVTLDRAEEINVNGQSYRVLLMQGSTKLACCFSRKQRLVINILMLPNARAGTGRIAGAQS